jgi:hypothetical protein
MVRLKTSIVGNSIEAVEQRAALKAHLATLIEKIEVFAEGFAATVGEQELPRRPKALSRAQFNDPVARAAWHKEARKLTPTIDDFADVMDEQIREYAPELARVRPKRYAAFLSWLQRHRSSKRGRFYRLHLRTSAIVSLAPTDSYATRWRLVTDVEGEKTWIHLQPEFDWLWAQFVAERNRTKRLNV